MLPKIKVANKDNSPPLSSNTSDFPLGRVCIEPANSCLGVDVEGSDDEHPDGRRHQALDSQAQNGPGPGHHPGQGHDLRGQPFLLRSDNGLVFTSRSHMALFKGYGLQQEFITPYSPEQNGMVERVIRTLKDQCGHRHQFETLVLRGN